MPVNLRAAVISMKHIEGDVDANLERHAMWLERALDAGARTAEAMRRDGLIEAAMLMLKREVRAVGQTPRAIAA